MQDGGLIQIVDATMAEAVRKSGSWLVCRPGCWDCCVGPFPISESHGERLRRGLAELKGIDPARAERVLQRAREWREKDPDQEPCPVLDRQTGTCDLYSFRPVTCRLFGPPVVWGGDVVGVCELCFQGASDEEIAGCAVTLEAPQEAEETEVAAALLQ